MTMERRLEIYKRMLSFITSHLEEGVFYSGFCLTLMRNTKAYDPELISDYPELYKHKPFFFIFRKDEYWFPRNIEGTNKRIAILNSIIKKMERKLK